jgi:diguanylate cyclase (GGDEF)-like protein
MGGDEFALLFSGEDPEEVIHQGVKQLDDLASGIPSENKSGGVSLSIGMISFSSDTDVSISDIYQEADEALYEAKKNKVSKGQREDYLVKRYLK